MKSYQINEINAIVKGEIVGSTTQLVTSPEELDTATHEQITFIGSKKFEKLWATSKASIAIVNEDISIAPGENRAFIKVKNADLTMCQVVELFATPSPVFHNPIHPNATVDPSAIIGENVKIGAGCYIGLNVKIGNNSIIYPNVTILDEVIIGFLTVIL